MWQQARKTTLLSALTSLIYIFYLPFKKSFQDATKPTSYREQLLLQLCSLLEAQQGPSQEGTDEAFKRLPAPSTRIDKTHQGQNGFMLVTVYQRTSFATHDRYFWRLLVLNWGSCAAGPSDRHLHSNAHFWSQSKKGLSFGLMFDAYCFKKGFFYNLIWWKIFISTSMSESLKLWLLLQHIKNIQSCNILLISLQRFTQQSLQAPDTMQWKIRTLSKGLKF